MTRIRVLSIDDSALMRGFLRVALSADPEIEVVGTAQDAFAAREMIKQLSPDVLTLDVEMPNMNGLEFLANLMRLRPMPVVMFSSLTDAGSDLALEALALGAIDVVAKPDGRAEAHDVARELIAKIKAAAASQVDHRQAPITRTMAIRGGLLSATANRRLIAIGASTGGVRALRAVLEALPSDLPPIVIAQHMPQGFTRSFAERLDAGCEIRVVEGSQGLVLTSGMAVIAPGERDLSVERENGSYVCRIRRGADHIKPSVDELFVSAAAAAGRHAVGIVLTGMGKDGARGLGELRRAGAITACQDEASSLIYGMPKAALEAGAARYELSLDNVPAFIEEPPTGGRLVG